MGSIPNRDEGDHQGSEVGFAAKPVQKYEDGEKEQLEHFHIYYRLLWRLTANALWRERIQTIYGASY